MRLLCWPSWRGGAHAALSLCKHPGHHPSRMSWCRLLTSGWQSSRWQQVPVWCPNKERAAASLSAGSAAAPSAGSKQARAELCISPYKRSPGCLWLLVVLPSLRILRLQDQATAEAPPAEEKGHSVPPAEIVRINLISLVSGYDLLEDINAWKAGVGGWTHLETERQR